MPDRRTPEERDHVAGKLNPDGTPEPADLPAVDEPPQSGEFVEHDELELTDDEIAAGNRLGQDIDPDDDKDSGDVEPPR